jgi:hypothetical protein
VPFEGDTLQVGIIRAGFEEGAQELKDRVGEDVDGA